MSVYGVAVVLVLVAVQLAQGLAIRFELADANLVVPVHIAIGVLTALIVIGLIRSMRQRGSRVTSDLMFLLALIVFQGIAGLFILANVELASTVHLVLSFFVVASAAASLIITASSS